MTRGNNRKKSNTKSSASSQKVTPSDRPHTYFGNIQHDHVTPYGFIKSAIEYHAKRFFLYDRNLSDLEKNNANSEIEDFGQLQDKNTLAKDYHRQSLIRILSAVLILNKDDEKQAIASIMTSSETDATQHFGSPHITSSSSLSDDKLSPNSKRRSDNISQIEEIVMGYIDEYKEVVNEYIYINEKTAKVTLEGDEDGEQKYKDIVLFQSNQVLEQGRKEVIARIAESALILFNNIKGITYDNGENNAQALITKRCYFDFSFLDQDIKSGAGDSPFVCSGIKALQEIADKYYEVQNMDDKKEFSPVKIGNVKLEDFSVKMSNAFFLPKMHNKDFLNQAYNNANSDVGVRQNSTGELQHHMARHLFLITACFPFIDQTCFYENSFCETQSGRASLGGEKWEFDHLLDSFVGKQLNRYNITGSRQKSQYVAKVKDYYNQFNELLNNYLDTKQINIDPTPQITKKRSFVSDNHSLLHESRENIQGVGLDIEYENKDSNQPPISVTIYDDIERNAQSSVKKARKNQEDTTSSMNVMRGSNTMDDTPTKNLKSGSAHSLKPQFQDNTK